MLDRLQIRYRAGGDGTLVAMWEQHALFVSLEGSVQEILVVRIRPHRTVPPEFAGMAYRAINEWNHTSRFLKAYVGDATARGQLPVFAEFQLPLRAGATDEQLMELLESTAGTGASFVDWLSDEGGVLF
jgi:hypothetical protein